MFLMKITKILKLLAIPLIGGFAFLFFMVAFASILSFSLQVTDWYTAEMFVDIVVGLVVIELGLFYLRSQMRLQTPSRISAVKKLARSVVITFFAGLIITFLFTPLYSWTFAPDTLGMAMLLTGQIAGLGYLLQSLLFGLINGPFVYYFSLSFVVLSLFDILRIRDNNPTNNPSDSQRLDSSPVVR
jgi:hypothetical protein